MRSSFKFSRPSKGICTLVCLGIFTCDQHLHARADSRRCIPPASQCQHLLFEPASTPPPSQVPVFPMHQPGVSTGSCIYDILPQNLPYVICASTSLLARPSVLYCMLGCTRGKGGGVQTKVGCVLTGGDVPDVKVPASPKAANAASVSADISSTQIEVLSLPFCACLHLIEITIGFRLYGLPVYEFAVTVFQLQKVQSLW